MRVSSSWFGDGGGGGDVLGRPRFSPRPDAKTRTRSNHQNRNWIEYPEVA